ncbi:MAG: alpha/beta fold hydrolase [bacterium]|nr:alpha/beta fold hydrolase [bacterium]
MRQSCIHARGTETARTQAPREPILSSELNATGLADGTLIKRERLLADFGVAVELVAYASSGLAVGGVLCYPDDGRRHSTVLHLHGGFGGIFVDADGNMVETCINWALLHGRTAFAPSYRGQDGGEGELELCLGEADDVAAAAILLRSLEMTDAKRIGLVGGSMGGCVALRAGVKIANLRAVVAFVPPTDWKALIDYHRTRWAPAVETLCDGTTQDWQTGGPEFADDLDTLICGHPLCSDAEYDARSPIPGAPLQTAPTLIVSAESDNVVPLEQHLLWSILRQAGGQPVDLYVIDPCDPPTTPALAQDVNLLVEGGFHSLSSGSISSGLLFLINALGPEPSPP